MQKLNRWCVLGVGIVLLGGLGAAGFFMMIKPKTEDIADRETKIKECEDIIAQRSRHVADLKEFTEQLAVRRAELEEYKERFVSIRYENTTRPAQYATMVQLWTELRERLAPAFLKFVPDVSGCEFTGVQIPRPPTQLSAVSTPPSGFIRVPPSGAITLGVRGRYEDINKLLRSMHQFSRLITVGPPRISGTAPTLNASIPIAFYVIADVPEGALTGPSSADIAGTSGGGGGGGGAGMMGGGMEGMGDMEGSGMGGPGGGGEMGPAGQP